jgi:hypothetical protein
MKVPGSVTPCTSVRQIDEYLASQRLNLDAGQAKPLVELFNALSVYQAFECNLPPIPEDKLSAFPAIVGEELQGALEETDTAVASDEEKDPIITDETVAQMRDVATAAPPEFQSAVFYCVSDYERCNTYYVAKGKGFDAGLGCGVTFMMCVAQQLIPLAGK